MIRSNDSPNKGKTVTSVGATGAAAWNSESTLTTPTASSLRSVFGGWVARSTPENNHGDASYHSGFSSSGSDTAPPLDKEELEKYGKRIQQTKVGHQECRMVLEDEEQFARLQQRLRDAGCLTDAVLKLTIHELLRERVEDMRRREMRLQKAHQAEAEALACKLDRVNLENETSPKSVTQALALDTKKEGGVVVKTPPLFENSSSSARMGISFKA